MKEKILTMLETLLSLFAAKKTAMEPAKRHAPFLEGIDETSASLSHLKDDVTQLNEPNEASFKPTLLFLLLEHMVPVLRAWKGRFNSIAQKGQLDVASHQKALSAYEEQKDALFTLIQNLNAGQENLYITPVQEEKDPAIPIMKGFDRARFLETNPVQAIGCLEKMKRSSLLL